MANTSTTELDLLKSVTTSGGPTDTLNVVGTVTSTPSGVQHVIVDSGTVDTELPAATALSDTFANPTTPVVGSFGFGWNGTNWDRLKSSGDNADSLTPSGVGHQQVIAHLTGYNGTSWDRLRSTIANGLAVDVSRIQGNTGVVSTVNSSTSNITAGNSFTGTSENILNYSTIAVNLLSDLDLTLVVEQSSDGSNWDFTDSLAYSGNVGRSWTFQARAKFCRIVVSNGTGSPTTSLRVQTIFYPISNPLPSSLTPSGNFKVALEENSTTFNIASPIPNITVDPSGIISNNGDQAQLVNTGYDTTIFNISGTWVGTISFFGVPDINTDVPIQARVVGTEQVISSTTTNGTFQLNIAGFNTINIRATAWTSGTALVIGTTAAGNRDQTVHVSSSAASATVNGISTDRRTALTNTAVAVKASSGRVYGYHYSNSSGSADAFVQFYDVAQGSVTVGTTTPKRTICVPANAVVDTAGIIPPLQFDTAITIAATSTATGGSAPSTTLLANTDYA